MPILSTDRSSVKGVQTVERSFAPPQANLPNKILVAGNHNGGNAVNENTVYEISSLAQASANFGDGEQLTRMIKFALDGNRGQVVYAVPLPAPTVVGTLSTTISFLNTATTNGEIVIYLSDKKFTTTIIAGETTVQIALKVLDVLNSRTDHPFTATLNGVNLVLTHKTNDSTADSSTVRINPYQSEVENSPGSVIISATADGAAGNNSSLDGLESILNDSDVWYTDVVIPYADTTSQDFLLNIGGHPNDGTGKYDSIDYRPFNAHYVFYETGENAIENLTTLANRPNDPISIIYGAPFFFQANYESACLIAGTISLLAQENPESSYVGTRLSVLTPAPSNDTLFTGNYRNRDTLYKAGVTPIFLQNNTLVLGDVITPWQPPNNDDAPLSLVASQRKTWNIAYDIKRSDALDENQNRAIVQSIGATAQNTKAIDIDVVISRLATLSRSWEARGLIFQVSLLQEIYK